MKGNEKIKKEMGVKTAEKKQKKLVIANWKMNPTSIGDAKKLFMDTKKEAAKYKKIETIIAAPSVYLSELRKLTAGKRTFLAAQNVFWEKSGTYTGETSVYMLKSVGVTAVIVGHSERRAMGETDDDTARKLDAVTKAGMLGVLCIGERTRDSQGRYLSHIEESLKKGLSLLTKKGLSLSVIAYEPLWAISDGKESGKSATPRDAHEMKIFILRVLTELYGRKIAESIPVLYGGSVHHDNAEELLRDGEVDGFLVGGASLKAKEFGSILSIANKYS